jgi:hypothetical protein
VETAVLHDKSERARKETERNKEVTSADSAAAVGKHHSHALKSWWRLIWGRREMLAAIAPLTRYIACGQVTKRPIFEFIGTQIHPNAALMVFPFEDDYSFGILQSGAHWLWFKQRCSTMKGDYRYTSNTVFDSFPWPQAPDAKSVQAVAKSARALRELRTALQAKHGLSLRELYRAMESPGRHPLAEAQGGLDAAVRTAYGFGAKADLLASLAALNVECAAREAMGEAITPPGFPRSAKERAACVTTDCIRMP